MWDNRLGREINKRVADGYPIEVHAGSEDYNAIVEAVNQGIDSYLEGISFTQGTGAHGRVKFIFARGSVSVLVRRLMESGQEQAESLASSICETLNIELI